MGETDFFLVLKREVIVEMENKSELKNTTQYGNKSWKNELKYRYVQ